ncbi:FAD dependent oxidoreductase [Aquisphaera giovannonii]|uniref:FAD dependent oxidoreductase n=1 Tax=Aquisphaera giovannonii TaxID=406548 RepID=A0A5B9VY66_9BACT|nr:FAD-dependent oxidoreductase [Aquisphaera giovannonii]QEH32927.1 FAD dependent oxidoreductase [Aquisphaera giovannonii]
MNRRRFLEGTATGLAAMLAAAGGGMARKAWAAAAPREVAADLVVIGGGLGGCAAAIAAVESGLTVVLTEPTDWIGGQLTSQAVPPDEHPWIEQFGCNARYRDLRDGIRDYYRRHYPLTAAARADRHLNPGRGSVSRLCHEPRVGLAVLTAMMAPFASGGKLLVLLEHEPVRAEMQGDRLRAVVVRDRRTGAERSLVAPYFADATELGDLLPMAGVEFVTGAEAQAETGEPHAPAAARPDDQQGITCCFAMDYLDGQDHTIDRPEDYASWRDYAPRLTPPWPGKLLAPHYTHPVTLKPVAQPFDPRGAGAGLWNYRRIVDPRNFEPGTFPGSSGMTLVNWPQNDCWHAPLVGPGVTPEQAAEEVRRAKQLSLSLLYWLQTEAPRPDGKAGWPGLRLRPDVVGTADGLAKAPYIRESRRIRAEFTVLEQHVGTDARRKELGKADVSAAAFPDSIGVGCYRIDLHPSTGGTNYIDVSSLPFQIPLGALIPRRVENLLPACKNLGTTHVTNGCYRLHPVEWAIGEAVGTLAAHSLATRLPPRAVRNRPEPLAAFQKRLVARGVELTWPTLTPR